MVLHRAVEAARFFGNGALAAISIKAIMSRYACCVTSLRFRRCLDVVSIPSDWKLVRLALDWAGHPLMLFVEGDHRNRTSIPTSMIGHVGIKRHAKCTICSMGIQINCNQLRSMGLRVYLHSMVCDSKTAHGAA
jgi:hypothetical protein